jgi:MFS family permease
MLNKLKNIRKLQTFSSLKNRVFRTYYLGLLGQWAPMNMQILARSYLIHDLSSSGTILGLSALANAIPMLLFSLPGGTLADRVPKKYILIYTQIGSALLSLAVALCLSFGYLSAEKAGSWWILIAAAGIEGVLMGLMMPARQAIIAEIVEPARIMNAVSLNTMGMNALRILAPAAAGFLIEGVGYELIYYVSTALYVAATICIILIPKTTVQYKGSGNALKDILDGLNYIKREKTIMLIIVATLFVMLCGIPFMQLMPMITSDILKVGPSGMGILMSVSGAGAIVGSATLASLPSRKRGAILLAAGAVMGVALVAFAFSRSWVLSIILVIFVGLGQSSQRTAGNALIQNYTEAEYRGRVMSFMMMELGFSSLGVFFAGVLADAVGIQWSIGGLAIALVIMSVILTVGTKRLRRLD